jgi:uncharacterized damage-inducible protein DinB
MSEASSPIDVLPFWARMNDQIVRLIDYIPDEKLNWSPQPQLWNFRGILIHVSMARHNWLGNQVRDGEPSPDVLREGRTKDELKHQLRVSWERLERFVSDPAKVDASYQFVYFGKPETLTGHWLAYHLLEHDVHHRADIFHYLALLGIEHSHVETP